MVRTLVVEIQLGNDQMNTPVDVSIALVELGRKMMNNGLIDQSIKDENGNTVGSAKFVDKKEKKNVSATTQVSGDGIKRIREGAGRGGKPKDVQPKSSEDSPSGGADETPDTKRDGRVLRGGEALKNLADKIHEGVMTGRTRSDRPNVSSAELRADGFDTSIKDSLIQGVLRGEAKWWGKVADVTRHKGGNYLESLGVVRSIFKAAGRTEPTMEEFEAKMQECDEAESSE